MIWMAWRQFRVQAWAGLGALATLALALAVTGPGLAHLYDESGLASCVADHDCESAQRAFAAGVTANDVYPLLFFLSAAVLYLTPAAVGMFWGAPLVARELEAGTLRLAWSQGVTRTRWLATRLGLVGLAAVLLTGLLSLAVTWWSAPIDRAAELPNQQQFPNRFLPLIFGARDLAPIGYAVFACVLGVGVGLLVRRTVPAMAVTLAVLAAVQLAVPLAVRAHYVAPEQVAKPLVLGPGVAQSIRIGGNTMTVSTPVSLPGAWIISVRTIDAAGRPFTGPAPQGCLATTSSPADCDAAINQLNLRQLATYQPAERFGTFQRIEAMVYLVLALVMVGLCGWRIRRLRLS